MLKAFKRFLGCRRVVGWGLRGQFDLIRYYGERNGIFFNNVLVNVFEENEIVGGIKREKTPDGKIKSTSYLMPCVSPRKPIYGGHTMTDATPISPCLAVTRGWRLATPT